jgi:hypothetical protein
MDRSYPVITLFFALLKSASPVYRFATIPFSCKGSHGRYSSHIECYSIVMG